MTEHAGKPLERRMINDVKEVEQSVLETFKAEIPSKYFSDKTEKDYEAYARLLDERSQ